MSGTNVTYILGAGASCYSQPLVFDMKERMEALLYFLHPELNKDISKFGKQTKELFERYKPIVDEANKHYTPDTYAKKLWLTHQDKKLKLLKEFLNLYFLFEQDYLKESYIEFPKLKDKEIYNQLQGISNVDPNLFNDDNGSVFNSLKSLKKKSKIKYVWDGIGQAIDYRYDVFFATLLVENNETLELPDNINIISWNYDNQFELAYKQYCPKLSYKEILNYLKIYPCSDYVGENKIDKIIRLNGFANNYIKRRILIEHKDETKEPVLNFDNVIDTEINFYTLLKMLLENDLNDYQNNINFAWEQYPMQQNAINQSCNLIMNTDIIVIIGYSFPNFNREVDKTIFSKYRVFESKEIIIQVPNKYEYEKIKQRIQTIKKIPDSVFKHISDADQFYIPM